MYLKGGARKGPTFREAVLIHAISRLVLNPLFRNIQASWTKLGPDGVKACLRAGVNDLGGTLMNETITRAAGASHGQETSPEQMEQIITSVGRHPRQRTTSYGEVSDAQHQRALAAAELTEPEYTSAKKYERIRTGVKTPLYRPGLEHAESDQSTAQKTGKGAMGFGLDEGDKISSADII